MKPDLSDARMWLPFTAAAFALVFAIVILSDACTTVLLAMPLSESPTMMWYAVRHLATGGALLAGGLIALVAVEGRSSTLLVAGEAFASAALATIVILERLSLWAAPYLE